MYRRLLPIGLGLALMAWHANGLLNIRIPDISQIEHEPGDRALAPEIRRRVELFGVAAGAVDVGCAAVGVEKPGELDAVGNPGFHFLADARQAVAGRSQFDDEIGHQQRELALLLACQPGQTGRSTHDASGHRADPSGRRYSVFESNARPRPSCRDQFPSWRASSLFR